MTPETSAHPAADTLLTPDELSHVHSRLAESRDAMLDYCQTLPESAWQRPGPDGGWSAVGVLEHVCLIESRLLHSFHKQLTEPVEADWRALTAGKEARLAAAAVPKHKMQALETFHPTGALAPAELMAKFRAVRAELDGFVHKASEDGRPLKGHLRPHPAFGPLNIHQWLLLLCHHSDRHLIQIKRAVTGDDPVSQS